MKAILTIVVTKQIDEEDKDYYEDMLADGDISGIYENFEPEYTGEHSIIFKEVS